MQEDDKAIKRKEQRLRRLLKKEGFYLKKSRTTKHHHVNDWGGYRIVLAFNNTCEAGVNYDLSLEDVERFLNS